MSARRARRAATTGALALMLSGIGAGAHATVYFDESLHMSWDGHTYTGVTAESFLGTPVMVPGDSASRTLLVRNDGPTAGVLRASIVGVELLDPAAPDVHHATGDDQGSFYDDLTIGWGTGSASLTELAADGVTPFLETELAKGEEVAVTLSSALPLDATAGNRANVTARSASFDVLLEIGGEMPTDPPEEGTAKPVTLPPDPTDAGPPSSGGLPSTGAEVRLLAAFAALAAGVGAALLAARRRTAREATRSPGS